MHRLLMIAAIASLICATGIASAQTTPSKIGIFRGIVRDETEALVPGAQVTLSNLEKTDVKTAVSGARGEFSIEASPGTYELKAELRGLKASTTGPVRLSENEIIRMIMILAVDVPGRSSPPPLRQ